MTVFDKHRNLDVVINNKLSYYAYPNKVILKANKLLAFILKCCSKFEKFTYY